MKHRLRLQTQLLGVTAGLLVVLTVGALAAVHYYIGEQVREQAARKLRAGSHVLTSILERTGQQLLGRGRILVELPSLHAGLTEDPAQLEPLLQEVKAVRTANLLWATDSKGKVLASTEAYPPIGEEMREHSLIRQALEGEHVLRFDYFMDEWWLVLTLPVAVPDGPQLAGTVSLALLVGEAYLARLAELIETDVGFLWEGRQFWSTRWPETGRSPIAFLALAGGSTVQPAQEYMLAEGGRYIWASQAVSVGTSTTRPVVLLGVPLDETVLQQTARAIGWIALLVLLIGLVVLRKAIRSMIEPLKHLVSDSHRVGSGDLSHRATIQGTQEVAELASSFNQMVGNLHHSREALVQANVYTNSIIQRVLNSLIVADRAGRIRIINPATVELLGYTSEELVGRPFSVICAEMEGSVWQRLLAMGVVRGEERVYRTKQGRPVPVLFSSAVMPGDSGDVQGIVCIAQDIRERKHLESLKDAFLSTASHELRTPLSTIQQAASIVLDETLGPINAEQRAFLDTVARDTTRLIRLVEMLLDVSAIDSHRFMLHRQPLALERLVEEVCTTHRPLAGKRRLTWKLGSVPTVYADRKRLSQVLEHLLENAVQFTPESGAITVALATRDREVVLSVADTGPGIPREEQGQLFGKFVQPGRTENERSGGVGLGLVFCKKIAELHGGTIQVESEQGRGATFSVTLPIQTPEEVLVVEFREALAQAQVMESTCGVFLIARPLQKVPAAAAWDPKGLEATIRKDAPWVGRLVTLPQGLVIVFETDRKGVSLIQQKLEACCPEPLKKSLRIGVAVFGEDGQDLQALLARAAEGATAARS